jgi:hypothetical protein
MGHGRSQQGHSRFNVRKSLWKRSASSVSKLEQHIFIMTDEELYNELAYYTLSHPDPSFIHQHVVDAYAAQHASEKTKSIQLVFALVGLYLYVDKGFTGKQVQKAHMQLAKRRKNWEQPPFPDCDGAITIRDVLAAPAGRQRDLIIREWCISVWNAWSKERDQIAILVKNELGIG